MVRLNIENALIKLSGMETNGTNLSFLFVWIFELGSVLSINIELQSDKRIDDPSKNDMRAVIQFLSEGAQPMEIYSRLRTEYGDSTSFHATENRNSSSKYFAKIC